ncbi:lysozyme inhibitor LprI family protein [Candidatus Thiodiazotropha endoloripes]|uniref:Lysozyme inhibitor LprI-like N-terminal domain-containing protein n=1 Tax=Candidatus Thiodiazotropha endoloripes TaxID=1818881 RepID=A0A1E2UTL3_9GAMM|nr:lysozyme inhibitor LprI family protein [Candidatus Thiodiazotropha endoloripes]MCG7983766.1 lysozyme inhibitor LprI family protein [Candidatus Thiodiazotropha lotti]ODB98021.1 hypothetical protein A3196_15395 [Candidatus Thiodiazotropha endoloripes]
MSKTRDIIQEISDVRDRWRIGNAMAELSLRLFAIEQAFKKHGTSDAELAKYFPVALIACLEGYFRMAIKDLIDAGDPYLSNAEKPASSVKLDFSLLRAVHGKAVTVGEIVSHGVPLSSLKHIEAVFSSLLESDFLNGLRTVSNKWANEVEGKPDTPVLKKPDVVFADVARTFELRHIICHEIASAYEINLQEIERCFESCVAFLRAADEFISQTLHPNAPLTQTAMNISAGKSLSDKRAEVEDALASLRERLGANEIKSLNKSQQLWETYCDAWANFVAGERKGGGTIWPLLYAGAAEANTQSRLEEIKGYEPLGGWDKS